MSADAKERMRSIQQAAHKRLCGDMMYETPHDDICVELSAAITALEASHSRTETITPEMFEAGNAAQHPDDCTDVRAIYTAMQAARLIDQQDE